MNHSQPRKPGTLMLAINTGLSFLLPFLGLQLLAGLAVFSYFGGQPPQDDRVFLWWPMGALLLGAIVGGMNAVLYLRRHR